MIINMKKMDREKKIKLIYSAELLVFAVLFLIFGILKITGVMGYNPTRTFILNIITLAGAAWGITDFIWAISSKKRQARISLLDKVLLLPLVCFMITFDILCFVSKHEDSFYLYMLGSAFLYVAVIYTFEAFYHYKHPIPGLLDEDEEPKSPENSEKNTEIEENKDDSKSN